MSHMQDIHWKGYLSADWAIEILGVVLYTQPFYTPKNKVNE